MQSCAESICHAGFVADKLRATTESDCSPCPTRTFSTGLALTSCQESNCDPGSVADKEKAEFLKDCSVCDTDLFSEGGDT